MKYFLSLILFAVLKFSTAEAQTWSTVNYFKWTIKPGPATNQVDVYIRPNFNYGAPANLYLFQVQFAIGWATSCPQAGQPTVSFTIDPTFNSNGGGFYTTSVFPQSVSISPAGETYNVIYLERVGSGAQTYAANVEVKVGTVTLTGSAPACPVKIVDYADTGTDLQASCFVDDPIGNTYFLAPTSDGNFYNDPGGMSTAGGDATSGYAQLNSPVSLPVKLVSFTGKANNCNAALSWITSEEINFSRYEIEQSTDGVHFTKAGTEQFSAAANGHYSFSNSQSDGAVYYRLKMVDIDNKSEYSRIITVRTNCSGKSYFSMYPNPVTDNNNTLTLNFSATYNGKAQLSIYNMMGQQMINNRVTVVKGDNMLKTDTRVLLPGTYSVRVTTDNGELVAPAQKLLKQ